MSPEVTYGAVRSRKPRGRGRQLDLRVLGVTAAAVTRKMGYNEKVVESVLYAAPMHDIGKIGIPDAVLLKPGKLNSSEWDIMKQHTKIGAKILKDSITGFAKLGSMIALSHHEKWDGSGYPNGISGEDIPTLGVGLALALAFEQDAQPEIPRISVKIYPQSTIIPGLISNLDGIAKTWLKVLCRIQI